MRNYNDLIPVYNNLSIRETVQAQLNDLTKPQGSLGRLEEFVLQYCLCRGKSDATISKKALYIFAGDHGVTINNIAPFPKEVTIQMVHNIIAGGAAISVMCKNAGIDYKIVDMGIDADLSSLDGLINKKIASGTKDFLNGPAMTVEQCESALEAGFECAKQCDADLCGIGEMGIGNSSSASALFALLLDKDGASTVGKGTGAEGELLDRKREIIRKSVEFHKQQWNGTAFDALCRVGGYEIAGMTGFILGCASMKKPVVVDGFITTASALVAIKLAPAVKDYLFFGHVSNEQFHRSVLSETGSDAILQLEMRLGEGTGAALSMHIIEQALNCYHQMATFSSAKVTNRAS